MPKKVANTEGFSITLTTNTIRNIAQSLSTMLTLMLGFSLTGLFFHGNRVTGLHRKTSENCRNENFTGWMHFLDVQPAVR